MTPEIKAKWVKKLRSGKYKQGQGKLQQDNKYCCLGLLCEVAVEERVIPPVTLSNGMCYYSGLSCILPEAVQIWAGIDCLGQYTRLNMHNTLAGNNDKDNMLFSEIADIIESPLTKFEVS